MKRAIVVTTLFLGIVAVSCKKDDEKQATTFELVTSTTWKIDTIGWDMNKDGTIETAVGSAIDACALDNSLKFNVDSTGVVDEGTVKCDDAEQSTPFDWTLNDTSKVITFAGLTLAGIPDYLIDGEAKILTSTESSLILSKHIVTSIPTSFDGNLIVALQK